MKIWAQNNGYNRIVVFEAARGRQGLVSARDPRNVPGGKSLPERVAHALLPKPKPKVRKMSTKKTHPGATGHALPGAAWASPPKIKSPLFYLVLDQYFHSLGLGCLDLFTYISC